MSEHERESWIAAESVPLDALCERVVAGTHARAHAAVPRILARLAALAAHEPHGAAPAVHRAFAALAEGLLAHLAKEKNILFPALVALAEADRMGRSRPPLAFPTVLHPIQVLEAEQARLTATLDALDALVQDQEAPTADDETWRAVKSDLAAFRCEVVAHAAFQTEVLFPRALELDRRI